MSKLKAGKGSFSSVNRVEVEISEMMKGIVPFLKTCRASENLKSLKETISFFYDVVGLSVASTIKRNTKRNVLPGRDTYLRVQGMVRTIGISQVQYSHLPLLPKESEERTNKSFKDKHKKAKKSRQYKVKSTKTFKQEAKLFWRKKPYKIKGKTGDHPTKPS